MIKLLWNLTLALLWMLLQQDFSLAALATGLLLGMLVISISSQQIPGAAYGQTLSGLLRLLWRFFASVCSANVILARDILRRRPEFTHAFVAVDTRDLGAAQTVLLGNMISLTPGSLTVDVERNGDTLYVHTLYGDNIDGLRQQIAVFSRPLAGTNDRGASNGPEPS